MEPPLVGISILTNGHSFVIQKVIFNHFDFTAISNGVPFSKRNYYSYTDIFKFYSIKAPSLLRFRKMLSLCYGASSHRLKIWRRSVQLFNKFNLLLQFTLNLLLSNT